MVAEKDRLLGRLVATQETLLRTVEKLEAKIDAQAAEIQDLKSTITSIRAGGRVLLWVAGALGTFLGFIVTSALRIWQSGQ